MTTMGELRSNRHIKEQEITEIAHKIEDRIDFYRDWQNRVRDSPLRSLGLALGAGFLIGGGMGGRLVKLTLQPVEGLARAAIMAYIFALFSDSTQARKIFKLKVD